MKDNLITRGSESEHDKKLNRKYAFFNIELCVYYHFLHMKWVSSVVVLSWLGTARQSLMMKQGSNLEFNYSHSTKVDHIICMNKVNQFMRIFIWYQKKCKNKWLGRQFNYIFQLSTKSSFKTIWKNFMQWNQKLLFYFSILID